MSLQRLADEDLAHRSQTSGLVYPVLYAIIMVFSRYADDHRAIAVLTGLTILVAALLRTRLVLKFNTLYRLNPGSWLADYSALTLLLAGVWAMKSVLRSMLTECIFLTLNPLGQLRAGDNNLW